MMKYSIVIPVCGDTERLDALLWSLEEKCRRRHAEIVVVADEACNHDDFECLGLFKRQRRIDTLVEHGSTRGFAAAVNSGIRNSAAGIIMVLHADVVAGPNTLGRLASRLRPSGPADVVSAVTCCAPHSAFMLSPDIKYRFTEGFEIVGRSKGDVQTRLANMYGDFDSFCKAARITRPDLAYTEDGYFFAAMFSRDTWAEVGDMDESFAGRGAADRLWVDRLCALGGHMYADRSTYCHHEGGRGENTPKYEQAKRDMLRETGRLL